MKGTMCTSNRRIFIFLCIFLSLWSVPCQSFVPSSKSLQLQNRISKYHPTSTSSSLDALPIVDIVSQSISRTSPLPPSIASSMLIAETESWRQYVPLAVICLVLLDIVLGSPLANLALAPMRRAAEKAEGDADGNDDGGGNFGISRALNPNLGSMAGDTLSNPKERVDTATIAQDTLDKARGTLELMEYLEANKTPEQEYEEMRKKLDRQMEELDGQ